MAVDSTKVIAGRNFLAYYAPWAQSNALPANTVLEGTDWTSPWINMGYTSGGLSLQVTVNRTDIRVDQEMDPVYRVASSRDIRLQTNLAEMSASHIQLGTGLGTITTVAAISGTRGYDDLDIGSSVTETYKSVGFDVLNPGDNEAFRMVGWKCLMVGSMNAGFKTESEAQIAIDAAALPDTSTVPTRILKIRDIIAALP